MRIKENEQIEDEIEKGLDPSQIRIETKPVLIASIISRLQKGDFNLQSEFQSNVGIWSDRAQSRFIESLLIRIPIHAFYIDASNDDKWLIIDGLERINAIRRFVITNDLILSDLEFLTQFNNKSWNDLHRAFQRRILETVLTFFVIEKGTPPDIKYAIYKRIKQED